MATVKRRTDDRPKPWEVRWRDEAGRQRKRAFARKVEADRFRASIEHSLNTGAYVDPQAGKETFQAYAERWRVAQPHRPNTRDRVKSQLHTHAYPAFGGRPVAALRFSELQGFVTGLELAPSTARSVWRTVRAVFAAAVRDRAIGVDPTLGVKLPELTHAEIVPLTIDQVDALADRIEPRYRGLVVLGAAAGPRQGEAFAVEVDRIDFLRKSVKIDQQLQPQRGGGVVVCPLKSKASYRPVPLGDVAVAELAAHMKAYPPVEVEVLDTTGKRPVHRLARFVFSDAKGRPLVRNRFNDEVWAPARVAAGVPDAGYHDTRHFYASLLIAAGLSPKAVAKLLGHANAAMTLNVYSHLWPSDEDRSRQAIDDAFRRDVPQVRPAKEA
ncbi:site-specific integrase [Asanoa sp. WMMD1127]|uniref:tyrosine-type recombinase/integrase n=1 Tax=Asanoa sp. WMMD1127 TaxID=3016107 RepID=UPI0024171AA4|nr:site-specific integrase [Asanoa sp. WMMD1127]MDG4825672.1 site-specific integrase [Asanoa sp. WMMD1127]